MLVTDKNTTAAKYSDVDKVEAALTQARNSLLDLTLRNRLLNFKPGQKTVTVTDELPDQVFRQLVLQQQKLEFQPDEHAKDDLSEESVPILPPAPSCAEPVAARHSDRYLQTTASRKKLKDALLHMYYDANTAIQETGANMLFLALGFLEWTDTKFNKTSTCRAPLVLVPVRLERNANQSFNLSWTEDEVETNQSLACKLKEKFEIDLPKLASDVEDLSVEQYLDLVRHSVRNFEGWAVHREIVLGFFHFGKLRMYLDLDPEHWGGAQYFLEHPVLSGMFGNGSNQRDIAFESPNLDDQFDPEKSPIVTDADSTQHSVIVEAHGGRNLVIEGPPGTGKSQTITNLIAGFVYQGKSVLFLSEKAAALNVVMQNLKDVGLGDFCLELHSNKTRKPEVLASLGSRSKLVYTEPKRLDAVIREYRSCRDALSKYCEQVNKPVGHSEITPIQAIGLLSRIERECPQLLLLRRIPRINNSDLWQPEFVANCERKLDAFANALIRTKENDHSALKGIELSELLAGDERELKVLCEEMAATSEALMSASKKLQDVLKSAPVTHELLTQCFEIRTILPDVYQPVLVEVLGTFSNLSPTSCDRLEQCEMESHRLQQEELFVRDTFAMTNAVDQATLEQTSNDANLLPKLKGSDLQSVIDCIQDCRTNLALFSERVTALGVDPTDAHNSRSFSELQSNLRDLVTEFDFNGIDFENLCSPAANRLIVKFRERLDYLLQIREELAENLALDLLADEAELLAELESRNKDLIVSLGLGIVHPAFRETRSKFRAICVGTVLPAGGINAWIALLRKYERLRKDLNDLQNDKGMLELFGPHFHGYDTDWRFIDQSLLCSKKLSTSGLPKRILDRLQSKHFGRELVTLIKDCESIQDVLDKSKSAFEDICKLTGLNTKVDLESLDEVSKCVSTIEQTCKQLSQVVENFHPVAKLEMATTWVNYLNRYLTYKRDSERLLNDEFCTGLLAEHWNGKDTNWTDIGWSREYARSISQAKISPDLKNALLSSKCQKLAETIRALHDNVAVDLKKLGELMDELHRYGEIDAREVWNCETWQKADLANIRTKSLALAGVSESFKNWSDLKRANRDCTEPELKTLVEMGMSSDVDPTVLKPIFKKSYLESILRTALATRTELRRFSKDAHLTIRRKFVELDEEMKSAASQLVAARASSNLVPPGNFSTRVSELTDRCLIDHEVGKTKRHRPVRELVQRAGAAMIALKPIFLMSPLSVAQYLPPRNISFDVLIMDEASQIKPENAFGAVARANQIIVVGDSKQLPPTDFFDYLGDGGHESDETATFEELESILEVSNKIYPSRMLKWHYRSKHHDLIQFSNSEYYAHQLRLFPSPDTDDANKGIKFNYVADGVYDRGKTRKNRIEARRVAEAIIDHAHNNPRQSLGVGTLSAQQKEAIEEELELLLESNRSAQKFLDTKIFSKKREEPFFIKNLENIQGDERDVIFISIGYAKDGNGVFYQNFGPMNRDGGWRRLNVLVTRARERVELFSSIRAEDIELKGNKVSGSAALRRYLHFAEKKLLDQIHITDRGIDSPFEEEVVQFLRSEGYQVTPQLGVAGFYIDIAVHHPNCPPKFVLGVECDGATYHSDRSTRDRDRLREQALVNQGWTIHRIWSTSWNTDRKMECRSLLNALQNAISASDSIES